MWSRRCVFLLAIAGLLGISGCSSASYYAHVLRGGWSVLAARHPIAQIVSDPAQDAELRERLTKVQAARRFAVTNLGLPDNGSYTSYSDVHQPYVVYNVFAAPPLSLKAVEHCFPVAGCVAYRGYYALDKAKAEAAELKNQGYETFIGGVSAYSTLGWFDDPVLSSMLRWDDERLAATVFHELAHQVVYAKGDTAFNESFAKFVELEGLRQWRLARGLPEALPADLQFEEVFIARVMQTRAALQSVYGSAASDADKTAAKQVAFSLLQSDFAALKAQWNPGSGYDGFFATPLNNAKLLPFGLYHQWLPAFRALYAQSGGQWVAFYKAVARLGALNPQDRSQQLQQLQSQSIHADAPSP